MTTFARLQNGEPAQIYVGAHSFGAWYTWDPLNRRFNFDHGEPLRQSKRGRGRLWVALFLNECKEGFQMSSFLKQKMDPKPVVVNFLRSPEIDSKPGGPVPQPDLSYWPARLYSLEESILRIDSWASLTFTNTASELFHNHYII